MNNNSFMCAISMILLFQAVQLYPNEIASSYIKQYKEIAIEEMNRTGIPASIKMGQAILESNMGRSELARRAKNHFGIKCGSRWNGDTYYLKDDDRDRSGRLIKSCFRTFDSSLESFIAHSEFLLGSRSGRYDFLFEYDPKDYKSWAYGLRKAGYATDKRYPQKLISIIEKYQLHLLDKRYDSGNHKLLVEVDQEKDSGINRFVPNKEISRDNTHNIRGYQVFIVNRTSFVLAKGDETLEELAERIGLKVDDLKDYNEQHGYAAIRLTSGEPIYISSKKRGFEDKSAFHVVEQGEDMYRISQLYGIKLHNLYAKNKMPKGSQPLVGEKVFLGKTAPSSERPAFLKRGELRNEETEFLFAEEDEN